MIKVGRIEEFTFTEERKGSVRIREEGYGCSI